MTLSEYLEKYNKTLEWFAKELGTSKGYVHDLRIGRRVPSLAMIKRIQDVTKNKVKAKDWIQAPTASSKAKSSKQTATKADPTSAEDSI
jgi:transcriptional regulator with XRE-family HTH domain